MFNIGLSKRDNLLQAKLLINIQIPNTWHIHTHIMIHQVELCVEITESNELNYSD